MESGRRRDTRFRKPYFPLWLHHPVAYEQDANRHLLRLSHLDRVVRHRYRHIRGRQLQVLVTRLGGERRRPPRTNIQATRRSLERNPCPDHGFLNFSLTRI